MQQSTVIGSHFTEDILQPQRARLITWAAHFSGRRGSVNAAAVYKMILVFSADCLACLLAAKYPKKLEKTMFLKYCVVLLVFCIHLSLNVEVVPGKACSVHCFITIMLLLAESNLQSRFILAGEPTRWRINDTDVSCNYSTSSDPGHSFIHVYRDNGKSPRCTLYCFAAAHTFQLIFLTIDCITIGSLFTRALNSLECQCLCLYLLYTFTNMHAYIAMHSAMRI